MNKRELKTNVAEYLNMILSSVRRHFEQPALRELAERVASYRVTRCYKMSKILRKILQY